MPLTDQSQSGKAKSSSQGKFWVKYLKQLSFFSRHFNLAEVRLRRSEWETKSGRVICDVEGLWTNFIIRTMIKQA